MRRLLSSLAITALVAMPAAAGEQDFTFVNATGGAITHLYVSAHSTNDWEEDVLGQDVLADDASTEINFSGSEECAYDIKFTFEDGASGVVENVNLCEIHAFAVARDGDHFGWAAQ